MFLLKNLAGQFKRQFWFSSEISHAFQKNSLFWKQHCSSPALGVVYFSLSSNIHTLLFPLANAGEAAALGNEPASPVAHTSLQLLTKFHYKNLDYTGEHRGMQEHSFISRYQIEFVGQEVKRLCYALGLIKSAWTCHNSSSLQPIPPHSNNSSAGISFLLLWPEVTSHCVMMDVCWELELDGLEDPLQPKPFWSWLCSGHWNCRILPTGKANAVVHTCHGEKLPNLDKKLQQVPLASGHLPMTKGHSR